MFTEGNFVEIEYRFAATQGWRGGRQRSRKNTKLELKIATWEQVWWEGHYVRE